MGCKEDVQSSDGRTNKDSTKGRGDVLGHGRKREKWMGGGEGEFVDLAHTKLRSGSQQIYTRFLSLSRNARIIEQEACYCDFCQRGIRVSPTNGMTSLDGDRAAMFQLVIRFVQSMREVILRIAAIHYDIRSRFREYPARQSTLGSEKGVNYPS